jgi:hypothetical protein
MCLYSCARGFILRTGPRRVRVDDANGDVEHSHFWGVPTLKHGHTIQLKQIAHGSLSSSLGLPHLSRNPAPLSSLVGLPLLSKQPAK